MSPGHEVGVPGVGVPGVGVPGVGLQVVVLAAGLGSRLGRGHPKALTPLADGRSMLRQQVDGLRGVLGLSLPITVVVGFRAEEVMAEAPDLLYAYAPRYAVTNTAVSLLQGLQRVGPGSVLWLNGDVVFDPQVLAVARPLLDGDETFVGVNRERVAEEEVKYTLDQDGFVRELSKTVVGGLGEAVGINHVSSCDRPLLVQHLQRCADGDYFERALERAVEQDGLRVRPLDLSAYDVVEVDVEDDLVRADRIGVRALRDA